MNYIYYFERMKHTKYKLLSSLITYMSVNDFKEIFNTTRSNAHKTLYNLYTKGYINREKVNKRYYYYNNDNTKR